MEDMIIEFIGKYGWVFITTIVVFFFKGAIENLYYGIRFIMGNDYNKDDIVYMNGKKCRIVRMGVYRTTFYNENETRRFHISNNKLQNHIIEKELMK